MAGLPPDILLYALLAAGLVLWLRSVLGTRHGEEHERPNPFSSLPEDKSEAGAGDSAVIDGAAIDVDGPKLPRNVRLEDESVEAALDDLVRQDKNFNLSRFTTGAQDAFVLIVESFAEGDRDTLKDLLTDSVYKAFDRAIKDREAESKTVSTEIHAVRKMDILAADVISGTAYITVRFTVDETCIIRDSDGDILSGDPDRVTEMIDIWVFGHDIKSKDPRWLVYETRDGDVIEDHKTPVPDAS